MVTVEEVALKIVVALEVVVAILLRPGVLKVAVLAAKGTFEGAVVVVTIVVAEIAVVVTLEVVIGLAVTVGLNSSSVCGVIMLKKSSRIQYSSRKVFS